MPGEASFSSIARPNTKTETANQARPEYPPFLQWPSNSCFEKFKPDADLLQKALSPIEKSTYSIADQVFGEHKRHEYTNLRHSANLLQERTKLHKQHIQDIDHRHLQIQEELFGVRINFFPDRARRQSNLESQLLQLEQQRRDEELAFWKDTVELRQGLFESAASYKDAKHRYSVFSDVEAQYGRYGRQKHRAIFIQSLNPTTRNGPKDLAEEIKPSHRSFVLFGKWAFSPPKADSQRS